MSFSTWKSAQSKRLGSEADELFQCMHAGWNFDWGLDVQPHLNKAATAAREMSKRLKEIKARKWETAPPDVKEQVADTWRMCREAREASSRIISESRERRRSG